MRWVVTTLALAAAAVAVVVHVRSIDGVASEVFLSLAGDYTRFSESYTDAAFKKLRIGDSEDAVHELLADPLQRAEWRESGETLLYFSDSPKSGHFRVRTLRMRDGAVVKIVAQLHVD